MGSDRSTSVPERLRFEAIGSSNDVVLRLADQGVAQHTNVAAETMTDARAVTGEWSAPRGGLWMSVLWRPDLPVEAAPRLTLAAAWGVREGLRRATGVAAGLKWPNDLLVEGAKLGGVQVEAPVEAGRIPHAAIGVAVNVNNPVAELPGDLPEQTTSIHEVTGRESDLEALTEAVAGGLREARELVDDPSELRRAFASCWTQKGAEVEVDAGYEMVSGRAVGLTEAGGLELHEEETTHEVEAPHLAKVLRVVEPEA